MSLFKGSIQTQKIGLFVFFLLLGLFIFYSFSKTTVKHTAKFHIIVAKAQHVKVDLYYGGIVQPLKIYNIVSPVDGIIKKNYFHYGSEVLKNQLLVEISSAKMKQDYANALTDYIKEKDQYLRSQRTLESTTALYQAEIVDKETYLNDQSQFKINQLSYLNAQNNLKNLIKNMPGENQSMEDLASKNIEDIQGLLDKMPDEFKVYSPFNGTLLMPQKSTDNDLASDAAKVLIEGSEVKRYQTLVMLGDMTGISTTIYINELDINQITVGQEAMLTNPALPGVVLRGKVVEVGRQAKQDSTSSSSAVFPVRIVVPQLDDSQRQLIRLGMSLKVNLVLHVPMQIKIPIQAVFEKNDHHLVNVLDPKDHKIHSVVVKTGMTDLSEVTILEGIKPGDSIVIYD